MTKTRPRFTVPAMLRALARGLRPARYLIAQPANGTAFVRTAARKAIGSPTQLHAPAVPLGRQGWARGNLDTCLEIAKAERPANERPYAASWVAGLLSASTGTRPNS